jgi:prepilin-type processing-associated H-X9-DG protein
MWQLGRIQQPADTVYFADYEDPAPVIAHTHPPASWHDIWSASHLPYTHVPSGQAVLNRDRRVAAARHGAGANLLFFDAHAAWRKSDMILVDDWRAQKWD